MAGKGTISDKYRDVASANPGREIHSGMDTAGETARHMETFKFDRAADTEAQATYHKEHPLTPLFTTEGSPVVRADAQRARIKAQVASHKNPRNRAP